MAPVRVALVSPYSYTYPGGVGRHVEALADELIALGHEVRLLAPYDPDDRVARLSHRGARPQRRPLPDHVIPMGRTLGLPMNGAVSNLATFPRRWESSAASSATAATTSSTCTSRTSPHVVVRHRGGARAGRGDLPHLFHERPREQVRRQLIGARRLYSKLSARIAVSDAARWTAQRYYGGRYRVIPNGVDLSAARPDPSRPHEELGSPSSGARRSARDCPSCCARSRRSAASACPRGSPWPAPAPEEVEPLLLDPEGSRSLGQVDEAHKWQLLGEADLLCARHSAARASAWCSPRRSPPARR